MIRTKAVFILTTFYMLFANMVFASNHFCLATVNQLDRKLPAQTSQLIIVTGENFFKANLRICEKKAQIWQEVLEDKIETNIGRNGLIKPGLKREGDGKTPLGLYAITDAFGTKAIKTNMNFRYITNNDKYIDDIESKDYNTWVTGQTDAKSYEIMLRPEYKLGFIINYNMNPIVRGNGSAIFVHIWESKNKGTSGCIAMSEQNIVKLFSLLDKNKQPMIYIQ